MQTTKDYTLHLICGIILFAALFSCNSNIPKEKSGIEINGRDLEYYTIDGCEYIGNVYGGNGDFMTHSGRCKNHPISKTESFYDGEGNPIPDKIVRLLVQSQFVKMTKQETDSINKYFYFNK